MSNDGRRWSGEQFPGFGSIDALLTRQGQVRYKLAAGQPRPSMHIKLKMKPFLAMKFPGGCCQHLAVRRPAAFW